MGQRKEGRKGEVEEKRKGKHRDRWEGEGKAKRKRECGRERERCVELRGPRHRPTWRTMSRSSRLFIVGLSLLSASVV